MPLEDVAVGDLEQVPHAPMDQETRAAGQGCTLQAPLVTGRDPAGNLQHGHVEEGSWCTVQKPQHAQHYRLSQE
jgi:hypothetical protein